MSQSPKTAFLNLKQESTQQEAFKHVETLRQDVFELEKALLRTFQRCTSHQERFEIAERRLVYRVFKDG